MIEAGLPTAALTEIKRSDGGGRVVRACHAIVKGHMPDPAKVLLPPTENWVHIEENDPNRIAETIVDLHRNASNFDPFWQFQVVSAQRSKHPFACDNLNDRLSFVLNPPKGEPVAQSWGASDDGPRMPFRVGDKVIRRKNGTADELRPPGPSSGFIDDEDDLHPEDTPARPEWKWDGKPWKFVETPIVNGDMGTVLAIVPEERQTWVVVKFRDPERIVRLPWTEHHMQLAYAITCHSAQGSGWPVVIVPVHTAFFFDTTTGQGLWNRELFYTSISRSEQVLITVGPWAAVRAAIGRRTVDRRKTRLVGLLRDSLAREAERKAKREAAQEEADREEVEEIENEDRYIFEEAEH